MKGFYYKKSGKAFYFDSATGSIKAYEIYNNGEEAQFGYSISNVEGKRTMDEFITICDAWLARRG